MPHRTMRTPARAFTTAAAATLLLALPAAGRAQNLGPYRQFLSLEPYYVNFQLDDGGSGAERTSVNGYGGRLWLNYAPFVRSRALAKGGLALFAHTGSKDGARVLHYGAEQDVFLTNRPFGGVLDPVVSVAGGVYRTSAAGAHQNRFALTPGVGVRIPVPNRLQLRVDARDAILFNQDVGSGSGVRQRTLNNFEFTGALGITF